MDLPPMMSGISIFWAAISLTLAARLARSGEPGA